MQATTSTSTQSAHSSRSIGTSTQAAHPAPGPNAPKPAFAWGSKPAKAEAPNVVSMATNTAPLPELFTLYHSFTFGRIKKKDRSILLPLDHIQNQQQLPWSPVAVDPLEKAGLKKKSRIYTTHSSTNTSPVQSAAVGKHHVKPTLVSTAVPSEKQPAPASVSSTAAPRGYASLFKSPQESAAAAPAPKKKKKEAPATASPLPATSGPKPNMPSHVERWRIVNPLLKGPVIIPRGLTNNGNMCFMNCILQPLLHTPPFYMFLMGLRQRGGLHPPAGIKTRVTDSMLDFVAEFRNGTEPADPLKDFAFSSDYVYDAIRSSTNVHSLKGRQEDATEFLVWLLDGIHEELLATLDKPRIEVEGGAEWTQVGKKNKQVTTQETIVHPSQVTRIFGGAYKSTVKSGGKESITTEPFTTVSLDMTAESITSLEEALAAIAKPEILEGFTSDHHQGHNVKQTIFERLPPVFLFPLKRTVYDSSQGGSVKLAKHISYPVTLEIPSVLTNDNLKHAYQLYAVVNHHGKFAEGGHYTCDIFHQSTGTWLRMDDTEVQPIEADVVVSKQPDRQPYMLFYISLGSTKQ
ncbi:Ubiquitin carboxyl-terminal hydrolase 10 [Kappamyces sp. JEL0829]|nr:Ubiquitin carboxyl-terminal hydrolase 10 [Kappamyces sp. JEL0829]